MSVSYEGIGHMAVTFLAGTAKEGQLCKLSVVGRSDACSSAEAFCGYVEKTDANLAAVQLEGFVTVPYTGTAPIKGYSKLSSNGTGGVKVDSAGQEYLVAAIDYDKLLVTFKL